MYCTNCGLQIPENTQFCSNCDQKRIAAGVSSTNNYLFNIQKSKDKYDAYEDAKAFTYAMVGIIIIIVIVFTFLASGLLEFFLN